MGLPNLMKKRQSNNPWQYMAVYRAINQGLINVFLQHMKNRFPVLFAPISRK
jgi:hypothetical protein